MLGEHYIMPPFLADLHDAIIPATTTPTPDSDFTSTSFLQQTLSLSNLRAPNAESTILDQPEPSSSLTELQPPPTFDGFLDNQLIFFTGKLGGTRQTDCLQWTPLHL